MNTSEEKKTYNGWKNYETWAVKLWLDNEQPSSEYWAEQAEDTFQQSKADYGLTKSEQACVDLSRQLERELKDSQPELGASLWSDLLNAAMSEVNWYEIANAFLTDNVEGYKTQD